MESALAIVSQFLNMSLITFTIEKDLSMGALEKGSEIRASANFETFLNLFSSNALLFSETEQDKNRHGIYSASVLKLKCKKTRM